MPDRSGDARRWSWIDDDDFTDLMARARSGDPAAIRDFLDRFEQEVRVMVRARLPRKLRPRFDSGDFVQAVWKSFFTGPNGPAREFENVAHLRGFLGGVVRNKVHEQHRRLTRTAKHNMAREERAVHLAGRSRDPARGRIAGPVTQRDGAGARPAGAVDGRVRPARDRGADAPPRRA